MDIGRPIRWIGSAYKDWVELPADVQDVLGYCLNLVQHGDMPSLAKPLNAGKLKGLSIFEILIRILTVEYIR